MCYYQQQFRPEVQYAALIHNFNKALSKDDATSGGDD